MTKRFTHKRWYNEHQLFDGETPFAIVDVYLQAENICNKLNELAEKNQELFDDLQNKTTWLSLRGGELAISKRENEQLKTTIKQLRTDNTKQKKQLNTTMKENEHIKQTIKDMIESERTDLGKMTLRQLWRQIQ